MTAISQIEYLATECFRLYLCVYVRTFLQGIWETALNAVRVCQKAPLRLQSQLTGSLRELHCFLNILKPGLYGS